MARSSVPDRGPTDPYFKGTETGTSLVMGSDDSVSGIRPETDGPTENRLITDQASLLIIRVSLKILIFPFMEYGWVESWTQARFKTRTRTSSQSLEPEL